MFKAKLFLFPLIQLSELGRRGEMLKHRNDSKGDSNPGKSNILLLSYCALRQIVLIIGLRRRYNIICVTSFA